MKNEIILYIAETMLYFVQNNNLKQNWPLSYDKEQKKTKIQWHNLFDVVRSFYAQ